MRLGWVKPRLSFPTFRLRSAHFRANVAAATAPATHQIMADACQSRRVEGNRIVIRQILNRRGFG